MKPIIIEKYADNGEHSHYELIDSVTGEKLWTNEDGAKIISSNLPVSGNEVAVCDFCGIPLKEQTDRCDNCWDEYSKKVKQTDR